MKCKHFKFTFEPDLHNFSWWNENSVFLTHSDWKEKCVPGSKFFGKTPQFFRYMGVSATSAANF